MTLSSRHRIRNLSPGGLRPSTLPLGHGGSPQYWLSHVDGEETIFVSFKPPRPGTEPGTLAWKAAVLTTTLGPPAPRPRPLEIEWWPPNCYQWSSKYSSSALSADNDKHLIVKTTAQSANYIRNWSDVVIAPRKRRHILFLINRCSYDCFQICFEKYDKRRLLSRFISALRTENVDTLFWSVCV